METKKAIFYTTDKNGEQVATETCTSTISKYEAIYGKMPFRYDVLEEVCSCTGHKK